MASPIVILTAVESFFGFLLTSTVLYLVVSRGRKAYHYLFAAFIYWFGVNLLACWLLLKSARKASSPLERRHHLYVIAGLLAVTLAIVKALVTMGLDVSLLLPLGMLLNDVFVVVIALAIIKDRLFDITVIIKKGALYSVLAGLLIFMYSLSEHLLITYVGETIGEESALLHLVSVAVGIAVLIPVKSRLERAIEGYFSERKLQF
jgi:hypothetical protein